MRSTLVRQGLSCGELYDEITARAPVERLQYMTVTGGGGVVSKMARVGPFG
ncbi:MAG TPA: hypothetical protein VGL97_00540 [Bryobacteraceae bacterium]